METEEKTRIDYLHYLDDPLRVSHETELVATPREVFQAEEPHPELVKEEIRKRKRLMAGLHSEVRQLEELL